MKPCTVKTKYLYTLLCTAYSVILRQIIPTITCSHNTLTWSKVSIVLQTIQADGMKVVDLRGEPPDYSQADVFSSNDLFSWQFSFSLVWGWQIICIFDSAPQVPKIKSLLPGSLKIIAISPCSLKNENTFQAFSLVRLGSSTLVFQL